jgi:hypothetical protein
MTVETEIMVGKYTSDGNYKILQLPNEIQYFSIDNYTQYSSTATPGVVKSAKWYLGMPEDSYLGIKNTDAKATDESVLGLTGGFRWLESQPNNLGAVVTGTVITAASPAVCSAVAHGYSIGDVVQITGSVGMLQIAGMEFSITATGDSDHFTIGYLPAVGFAAPASAFKVRRVVTPPEFFPRRRFITSITKAVEAVIKFSVVHGYSAGELITVHVPVAFGMKQIEGKQAKILSVDTVNNTITVDINTSSFDTFAFPASASVPFTQAYVVPYGDYALVLTGATKNEGFRGLRLGSAVCGAASDAMKWFALSAGYQVL